MKGKRGKSKGGGSLLVFRSEKTPDPFSLPTATGISLSK
jgi:hypothetical protein